MIEFFNTIWVALNSPNEFIINIILIFSSFIESTLIILFFQATLKNDLTKKELSIFIILFSLLTLLCSKIIPNPYYLFLNYFVFIILTKSLFKISFLKALSGLIFSTALFTLVGLIVSIISFNIFTISSEDLTYIPIYRLIYLTITFFSIYIIIMLIKVLKLHIDFHDKIGKKNALVLILNFIFAIFTLISQIILSSKYISTQSAELTLFTFLSLLIYFSLSIFSLNKVMKLAYTTEKLENAEEYNNSLSIMYDDIKSFKHDFDNIMMTIGGYIKTEDLNGLKGYYNSVSTECIDTNSLAILNPKIINNPGIYNLLANKYHKARNEKITMTISPFLDLNSLNMDIYDFTRIFGILLDNAIEASVECPKKIINIEFRNDNKNSKQIVRIENTYLQSDLFIHTMYEKNKSTKENHSGIGLWKVSKILKNYKHITLNTDKNDEYFIQNLEISNNR